MCKLLNVTPRELGEKRRLDPIGIAFLERHLIYRLEQEAKARKKAEQAARSRSKKGHLGKH